MKDIVKKAAELMECLPEEDQTDAYAHIRRLVLAWDPDFSKLTKTEAAELREATQNEYIDEEDMEWDTILGNK